jgi:hypothetical protein
MDSTFERGNIWKAYILRHIECGYHQSHEKYGRNDQYPARVHPWALQWDINLSA